MKKFLVLFLLTFSIGFAQNLSFKDKLRNAKKGDYIVFELNKFYSALCVFDIEEDDFILEEITIPKDKFDKNFSFRSWLENGAKKNHSWTIYKINLQTNKIKDAFSICKNSWIKLTTNESLITHLLDIDLIKLENYQRKKIGPPPRLGEIDRRFFWTPIEIVDSRKIENSKFEVFRSFWPDDGSEFSSKTFDIYFTRTFAFPYFIEINNGNSSYMIKAIDSGSNLRSTIKYFPRKKAELAQIKKQNNILYLKLINANYYKDFNLFAIDFSRKEKIIHPLKFEIKKDEDLVFLKIDFNYLNQIFEKNHKYKLIATPKFHKDIFIESKDLFIWK